MLGCSWSCDGVSPSLLLANDRKRLTLLLADLDGRLFIVHDVRCVVFGLMQKPEVMEELIALLSGSANRAGS